MELPRNHFKHAIAAGRQQIGFWCSLASNISVEIVAGSGFDWLLLDTEHSPNEVPMVIGQLQAVMEHRVHPIVRPAWNDPVLIKRFLDMGVQTLLLPVVNTAEEARAAVAATRYPPRGLRGFSGGSRSSRFGRIRDYHTRCEDEICVLVQVETQAGLDNIDAIVATEGVDGVFIGPGDLSAAIGYLGDQGNPHVQKVIVDCVKRIRAGGKAAGILTPDEALAARYMEAGTTFTAVGSDSGVLARQSEALARRFKKELEA
ncbi:MAG: 2-dehydro-3-deoxyglucarate aldolase [Hyphomicrobiales bacterium]|nr:2-dehydro-3-deoxyglucarate aldolase [Hyphomicrobiales bacterium]